MTETVKPMATRREWIGLGVLALACLLYSMDLTVLQLAVPAISADLQPTSAQLLWITDIYGFVLAGFLITMGTLGDRIGRRKLLLVGAAAFAVASVLAAFSTTPEMLIATRALLGVAGATLAPSTLSLIRTMFQDSRQRTTAIGVWISSFSAGAVVGPLLGGVVLEFFSWGAVFLLGVPVMLVLLVLGPIVLPEYRDPKAGRLDLVSAALSLIGVLAVIYGLKEVAQGGPSGLSALSVIGGLAVMLVFLRRQRTLADPLLDLQLFRVPAFSASLAAYAIATFVAFGAFFFVFQYLQLVLGLTPLQAGLWSAPSFAAFIVGSTLAPRLVRRWRPAFVMAGGLAVAAVGFMVVAMVGRDSGPEFVVIGAVAYSLGLAPVFTLTTDLVVGTAPPERAGAASGISETSSEFGGALGIAILGVVGTATYRMELAESMPAGVPPDAAETARDTLGGALEIASGLPDVIGGPLLDSARQAFVDALHLTATVSALCVIGLAVAVRMALRHVPSRSEPR